MALAALALAACDAGAPKFKSTDITGADYGKALALTDHLGKPRRLEDWRGKAVVVFFGFTHCPDVCPTTLADMAQVVRQLGADGERVQVLLYTLILFGVSLLPFAIRMSGWLYLGAALALGGVFIGYALRIHFAYSDRLARRTFRYSIFYLAALFAALLVDHHLAG